MVIRSDKRPYAKKQAQRQQAEQQLEVMRVSIVQRQQSLKKYLNHRKEPLPADFSEQAVELENDEAMVAIEQELNVELTNVDAALARLASGDYGRCANCGAAIGARRLAALPQSTLCMSCAEATEKRASEVLRQGALS